MTMITSDNLVGDITLTNDKDQMQMNLYRKFQEVIPSLNIKDTAIYSSDEIYTAGQWIVNANKNESRPIFRKVIPTGALPNDATINVAHNLNIDQTGATQPITADWIIVNYHGTFLDPTGPIWVSSEVSRVNIAISPTDIIIRTTADFSAYTQGYVTILYIKP